MTDGRNGESGTKYKTDGRISTGRTVGGDFCKRVVLREGWSPGGW